MNNACAGGLKHVAVSNYYPSAPYYPLNKIRKDQFKVQQEHAVVVNGQLKQGPFMWNDIMMDKTNGWYNKLDAKLQQTLPSKIGDCIFNNIPADVNASPNAEHHSFKNTRAHINSLGSFYCSGTFDVHNKYQLSKHGYAVGAAINWQDAFDSILRLSQFPDGGGITINHPAWSQLDIAQICQMLDYDNRVLGIEIWNETCQRLDGHGFALEMWDKILSTGRPCYGFAVPDHFNDPNWKGRNYLLIPEFNEKECLKAYRQGRFYCALLGNGLKFNNITLADGTLSVNINKKALIKIISDKGTTETNECSMTYKIPAVNGQFNIRYLRIEAEDDSGERIFSQPVMVTTPQD